MEKQHSLRLVESKKRCERKIDASRLLVGQIALNCSTKETSLLTYEISIIKNLFIIDIRYRTYIYSFFEYVYLSTCSDKIDISL